MPRIFLTNLIFDIMKIYFMRKEKKYPNGGINILQLWAINSWNISYSSRNIPGVLGIYMWVWYCIRKSRTSFLSFGNNINENKKNKIMSKW